MLLGINGVYWRVLISILTELNSLFLSELCLSLFVLQNIISVIPLRSRFWITTQDVSYTFYKPQFNSMHRCRRGLGLIPGQSMWDLWWKKWHWDRFPPPKTSVFPCQFDSTGALLHGKNNKLITFITELHNKPQGCGASVASAAGPFTKTKLNASHNYR
jgi:hypothetical protein